MTINEKLDRVLAYIDGEVLSVKENAFDIEQIAFECAKRGFFFDIRRVLSNRTTFAGKWICRLDAFGDYDGDVPYGEGPTAAKAIAAARKKMPKVE